MSGGVTYLLDDWRRVATQIDSESKTMLARADQQRVEAGHIAQLKRHFKHRGRGYPWAAVSRLVDSPKDASLNAWMRADPVSLIMDVGSARLTAYGDNLQLTPAEAEPLLAPMRTLFGDAGLPVDAPTPSRWYLKAPKGTPLPEISHPADMMGADIFEYMPEGKDMVRWRRLVSEAQMLLHQNPINQARQAKGLPVVNSLWFHGGGDVPNLVQSAHGSVVSDDVELNGWAALAKQGQPEGRESGGKLFDWRQPTTFAAKVKNLASQLQDDVKQHGSVLLDCTSGHQFMLRRSQLWRFWRKHLPPHE